eukprot:tig00021357_g20768.t1
MAPAWVPPICGWASSGLGEELARLLHKRGCTLSLSARRGDLLEALSKELQSSSQSSQPVRVFPLDVGDAERVFATAERVRSEGGAIDVLIVAAGINQRGLATADVDAALAERVVRTNLLGAIFAAQAVLKPMLAAGRGAIVGISSLAGYRALPGASVYGASKSALSYFLETLAIECRGTGVLVSDVCPGFFESPATKDLGNVKPMEMAAEQAAQEVISAIEARKEHHGFPWLFEAVIMRAQRWLPRFLYNPVIARLAVPLPKAPA